MTLTWSGLTQGLHTFLQTLIDAEATQHIGADPFQRTDTRTTHRNGTPGQGRLPGGFTTWNMSITFPGSSPDGSGLPGASDGPTAVRKPNGQRSMWPPRTAAFGRPVSRSVTGHSPSACGEFRPMAPRTLAVRERASRHLKQRPGDPTKSHDCRTHCLGSGPGSPAAGHLLPLRRQP